MRLFQDGIIATGANQFGGDGAEQQLNDDSLIPESQRIYANLRASFEFSPAAEVFVDAKFTRNRTRSSSNYAGFFDGLLLFPNNPFIPAGLQGEANDSGGIRISRDFTDLGANVRTTTRNTYRLVGGLRGEVTSNLNYEIVGNYGRTDVDVENSREMRYDRLFASIDVIEGPDGQPICRSDVSNVPHPGSEFFPFIEGGFFTFSPGDGSCVPTNLFGGRNAVSRAAADFITTPTVDNFVLEQTVITGVLNGDTDGFFSLPGGAVQFAVGAEYRKENSVSTFSQEERGILPAGAAAGPAGTFIGDISSNSPIAQNRIANCRADGIPVGFEDPLTARFPGTSAGNPNLSEERATTWTVGAVVQPRFIPGLTLSGDYYSIRINDAIQSLDDQDIVNTCYDLATFPNDFCGLFTRNRDAGSITFNGLNFLSVTEINFARLETSGIDFSVNYRFALGENNFNIGINGNWTEKLNRFFDPIDTSLVNPALREFGVPEWSGLGTVTWNRKDVTLNYQVQYIGSSASASAIEIERIDTEFGPAGFAPEYWVHNVSASVNVGDKVTFSGGVNNITDAAPYSSAASFPVSGMGRFLFVGAQVRY